MDAPEELAHRKAQEVPTTFRPGDLVRCNVDNFSNWSVKKFSEHRVTSTEPGMISGEQFLSLEGIFASFAARHFSLVQRAPVRSLAAHHEDEIVGGAHHDIRAEALAAAGLAPDPDDMVNLPGHYARFPIEPIRAVVENAAAFKDPRVAVLMGHVIPYLFRHEFKGGIQDLQKAKRLIDMTIKLEAGDPDWWKAGR